MAVLYGFGLCLQENLTIRFLFEILDSSHENSTLLVSDYPEIVELVEGDFILNFCHGYRETNFIAHDFARFKANCPNMCT